MIIEVVVLLAILTGGTCLLRSVGITGWVLPALGYVVGTALFVVIGAVQVVTRLPTTPVVTLALAAGLPLAVYAVQLHRKRAPGLPIVPAVAATAGMVAAVGLLRTVHLVNYHFDSYLYLAASGLLARGDLHAGGVRLLETRALAIPLIHAPASLGGELYLRAATPILGLASVAVLVWLCQSALRPTLGRAEIIGFTTAGAALLLSTNRFVFNLFYVNGHLLFAVLLLLVAGGAVLLARPTQVPDDGTLTILAVTIPAFVVTRPEASLVAGLAILPIVLSTRIAWSRRAFVLSVIGASVAVWHGHLLVEYLRSDLSLPPRVPLLVTLGLAALILSRVPLTSALARFQRRVLTGVELGLWMFLALAVLLAPGIMRPSLRAALDNLVLPAASWGFTLVLLAALVVAVWIAFPFDDAIYLRFPLTTFVPLVLLLAYLRGGPFRVDEADSLNRMMVHVIPLAILFIVGGASSRFGLPAARPARARRQQGAQAR